MSRVFLLRQVGLVANVKLHFSFRLDSLKTIMSRRENQPPSIYTHCHKMKGQIVTVVGYDR